MIAKRQNKAKSKNEGRPVRRSAWWLSQTAVKSYLETVIRHRGKVIGLVLAVTLVFAWKASGLVLDNDRELWLPQGHPYVETTRVIHKIFGGRNIVVIGIQPKSGDIYRPHVLEKIAGIQKAINRLPEAVKRDVVSLAAKKVKAIKGTPEGMEVHRMLSIPLSEEAVARLKQDIEENPFYMQVLAAEGGKAVAIVADFKMPKDHPKYAALMDEIKAAVKPETDDSVDIFFGGAPAQYSEVEHYTKGAGLYFGIAFFVIMLIQYWSFRSFQGMILPMLTGGLSVLWGLGVFAFLGINLDVLNTVTPILIMAVTSGHAIQLLKRYYEEYLRKSQNNPDGLSPKELSKSAIIDSLSVVGPIMVIAGFIAAATFFSLTSAGILMVRHFGALAGLGITSSIILETTFVPAVRSLLPPPTIWSANQGRGEPGLLDRILKRLAASVVLGMAPTILAVGIILVALVATGIARLKVDNSTLRYLSNENRVRADDHMLNATFGGTNTLFFLVEGNGMDSIKNPKVLQGIEQLQNTLEQQPNVGKTQSFADLVKQMNQAMHDGDPKFRAIPDNQDLVAQYLLLYSMSGDPGDFDNFVDNNYQKALLWVFLKDDSTANAQALYQSMLPVIAKNFPPGVKLSIGGSLPETVAMNDVVVREKILNTGEMVAVIFLLSSLIFRSAVGGIFVIIPVIFIVLANFGSMGWLGIPLDMGTATTASMAIGIGADYEIYLLYRFREELRRSGSMEVATRESLLTSGKAVLFVAFSIAGGYAVLLTSDFGFYRQLAFSVITTMVISAASALLFLRSMIVVFKPRFIFGRISEDVIEQRLTES